MGSVLYTAKKKLESCLQKQLSPVIKIGLNIRDDTINNRT